MKIQSLSLKFILSAIFIVWVNTAWSAAVDVHNFDQFDNGVEKEARYRQLIDELRCPKCQNQNLSGSNSPIAQDLRRELFRMVIEDKSDQAIKTFMVDRYGNFVLYEPPMDKNTIILWGAPLILLFLALLIALFFKRSQNNSQQLDLSDAEASKLKSILSRYT